jgi:hypothetical protein
MKSIKIGHQEWSSENLNVDHFNNGDEIQYVESAKDWLNCCQNKTPAWCYFDNIDSISYNFRGFCGLWLGDYEENSQITFFVPSQEKEFTFDEMTDIFI